MKMSCIELRKTVGDWEDKAAFPANPEFEGITNLDPYEDITESSFLVHVIVEHLKRSNFNLESDEVLEMGIYKILAGYNIFLSLSKPEYYLLLNELLILAEKNEIAEAMVKRGEIMPEDSGVMHFRQEPTDPEESSTYYPLPFSYPVDRTMEQIKRWGNQNPLF